MMTVTINSSATELTFTHELLDASYVGSVVLERESGCISTALSINTDDIVIEDFAFTINVEDFYGEDTLKTKFDDGVYKFTLGFDHESETAAPATARTTVTSCFVVDYDLKCKILEDNDPLVLGKYRAMFFADNCDDCDCTHLCTIYNNLIEEYTTTDDGSCGSC